MFGHRSDGKQIKTVTPLFKVIPNIMMDRADSQVFFKQDIPLENLDEYIDKKIAEGIRFSYMEIIYSAIVRIVAERPSINRFTVNGVLYRRNKIQISLVIKKSLTDEGQETSTKISFNGDENIFEVKEKLDKVIEKNKNDETINNTDAFVKILSRMPYGLVRFFVKIFKSLDKHGILPGSIIELSPFHTSAFLTNVGSLGIDSIYHHLYNFGTTSMFFAMGKKKKSYIYDDDDIVEKKCITLAFVGDERICDGYYYANSFKLLSKYLRKPELLEEHAEVKEDIQ